MTETGKLPPQRIVTLLGRIGGNDYAIIGPGGRFGPQWHICLWTALGPYESSYVSIASGKTVHEAMQNAFPGKLTGKPMVHPSWDYRNWRKGKYVG